MTRISDNAIKPARRRAYWALAIALCTLVLAIAAMCLGAAGISPRQVLAALAGEEGAARDIVLFVRLPRVAAAWLCGAALALSGLILQAALGNALASPGIIGVNSGAGFLVVLAAAVFPYGGIYVRIAAAFLGAMGASLLVYGIARRTGASRRTIVLAGVALSSLMSAGIDAVTTLVPETLADRAGFYIGGFGGVYTGNLLPLILPMAIGAMGAMLISGRINILLMGDEIASSLGLNVGATRFLSLMCASVLAASAVSVCGLLGFVGLIVPHAVRFLFGTDYRYLAPLSILGGGFVLLLCDTLSRVLFAPFEVPVGILLSALGAPFFLWLLLRRDGRLEI